MGPDLSCSPSLLMCWGNGTPPIANEANQTSPASDRVTHGEVVQSLVPEERKEEKECQFKDLYEAYEEAKWYQEYDKDCPLSGLQQNLLSNKYLKPIIFRPSGPTPDAQEKKDKNIARDDFERLREEQVKRVNEPYFCTLTKRVERLRNRIDQIERKKKTTKKEKKLEGLEAESDRLVNKARQTLDTQFRVFATILGVYVLPEATFSKAAFDIAMEDCFGSLEKPGTGEFRYPHMQMIRLSDSYGPHKIFSLYLSRKAFTFASPKELSLGLDKFFKRVSVPIDESTRDPALVQRAYTLMEAVSHALFQEQRSKRKPYNSGKACYELSRRDGGKRVAEYCGKPSYDGRGKVRPAAIWSSGKVRVITVDSAFNTRFSFLNKYMGDEIRKCKWSIFGQTVDSWLAEHPEFLKRKEDDVFVSGDLESATDLFDPNFARIVIKRLTDIYPEFEGVEDPYQEMISFTCDALLEVEGVSEEDPDRPGLLRQYFELQRRGQLMGSILSFPILCLVGLVSYLLKRKEGDVIINLYEKYQTLRSLKATGKDLYRAEFVLSELRDFIRNIDNLGINGDDIVFRGTYEDAAKWEQGVKTVGGVVSRGKTLVNPWYFTVNSELCSCAEGVLPVIRPSLAVSLSDGKYKTPDQAWFRYLDSPLRSRAADDIFKPELALFPDMPKFFGGLGSRILPPEEFNLRDFLTLLEVRPKAVYDFREIGISKEDSDYAHNRFSHSSVEAFMNVDKYGHKLIDPCNVPLPAGDEHREGLVDRKALHEFLRRKYTKSPTTIMWTVPAYHAPSLESVQERVRQQLDFMDLREARELYSLYRWGYEMDKNGLALFDGEADDSLDVQPFTSMSTSLSRGLESYKARKAASIISIRAPEDPALPGVVDSLRHMNCFQVEENRANKYKDCGQPVYLFDDEKDEELVNELRQDWRIKYCDPLFVNTGRKFDARAALYGPSEKI